MGLKEKKIFLLVNPGTYMVKLFKNNFLLAELGSYSLYVPGYIYF